MLDVIEKGPCRESHKTPVLFVHGAWHGAWCWDEHFLDFFAEQGYRSLAVSLRGHDMMLEPEWATVAERILAWLEICDPAT